MMDSIVSLPYRIVEWLSAQSDMDDIKFFVEYPPVNKAVPLRRTIVAVGMDSIDIVDKFVANDDGVLERQEYCRLAKIKANLSICVPFSMGGETCHDIFTRIANALTFRTNLNIAESGCTPIKSDRDTDALVMDGWFLMEADFCPAQSTDENFASFLDKDLICGSHVRNEGIHVTPQDKEKWNDQFIVGSYLGSGGASRSVNLGFSPKLVIATALGSHPCLYDAAVGIVKNYFGICTQTGGTGIEITASGFKAMSVSATGTQTNLNQAGTSYSYIAFK